jgi:L-threonylcarbamoyladenylate synthase
LTALPQIETIRVAIEAPGALERAAELLRAGELVTFPTDTVYGIGANAFLKDAVLRLYLAKERPGHLAIPLLLPDASALPSVCREVPQVAWELADAFWPGGLSLVLHRADGVPNAVTAGGSTVAVRVPDHDLVRELCRRLGAPIAATSANRHGQPSPVTADEVEPAFLGRVALLLVGGACHGGMASTVLDLTVSPPAILRPGPVTAEQLAAIVAIQSD